MNKRDYAGIKHCYEHTTSIQYLLNAKILLKLMVLEKLVK